MGVKFFHKQCWSLSVIQIDTPKLMTKLTILNLDRGHMTLWNKSITTFLIMIGSLHAYLSHNLCAIMIIWIHPIRGIKFQLLKRNLGAPGDRVFSASSKQSCECCVLIRESSFNMTRGGEDIEGGLRKFLDTRKGGSEKIRGGSKNLYTFNPKGGGGS